MKVKLRVGNAVRSADGALYQVRYVADVLEHAELYPMDDEGNVDVDGVIQLEKTELRKVAHPANRKPPIEGLPAIRPRCPYCRRPLRARTHDELAPGRTWPRRIIRRTFTYWRAYQELWCRQGCGISFATAAHKAGYRIVQQTKEHS